jgi:putative endonuclease
MRQYVVYILANRARHTYIGITSNLERRIEWHRLRRHGFTAKYNITRLVYCEFYDNAADAIAREKQLKGWTRIRKLALISAVNPTWEDYLPSS